MEKHNTKSLEDNGEWQAVPKKKIPLNERLDRISEKIRLKHSCKVHDYELHEAFKLGRASLTQQVEELTRENEKLTLDKEKLSQSLNLLRIGIEGLEDYARLQSELEELKKELQTKTEIIQKALKILPS